MNVRRSTAFLQGLLLGILTSSIVLLAIAMYQPSSLQLTFLPIPQVMDLDDTRNWVAKNFGLSLIPFGITLGLYFYTLKNLGQSLQQNHSIEEVTHREQLVDIWTSLFFGIGVIWTAIGMRSALLYSLGELNDTGNAMAVLERLVEGGILTALSTTILGGAGGYLMRLYKTIHFGSTLNQYYSQHEQHYSERMEELLTSIRDSVSEHPETNISAIHSCRDKP